MVDLDDAIIARLESHGETFEILLDPVAMDLMKQGKEIDLSEYLVVEDVFKDANKGLRPPEEKILEVFGTNDPLEIAKKVIEKGEVQVTTEQRRDMLESKRRRIIAHIAANAINPQTKLPHPAQRIEIALDEARFRPDLFKPMEKEIEEAMKVLRPLLPIRFEKVKVAIKLDGSDYARCYEEIRHYGAVEREEWGSDGSWMAVLEVPAGLTSELTNSLNQKTKGAASVKLLN
ncbi:MAG TPA: ribosome assembly factor SBDS [Candidatus Methanomethylophilaceae archaeon]|nr:ribosome assembly factor SBDS [Candidatus Methanomethylophilaceae archaeon]